MEENKID